MSQQFVFSPSQREKKMGAGLGITMGLAAGIGMFAAGELAWLLTHDSTLTFVAGFVGAVAGGYMMYKWMMKQIKP